MPSHTESLLLTTLFCASHAENIQWPDLGCWVCRCQAAEARCDELEAEVHALECAVAAR